MNDKNKVESSFHASLGLSYLNLAVLKPFEYEISDRFQKLDSEEQEKAIEHSRLAEERMKEASEHVKQFVNLLND